MNIKTLDDTECQNCGKELLQGSWAIMTKDGAVFCDKECRDTFEQR